jgi:hypothetical protein
MDLIEVFDGFGDDSMELDLLKCNNWKFEWKI